MGDRCWMRMCFRKSDSRKIADILGADVEGQVFDELNEHEHANYVEGQINEMNYGGLRPREEMTKAKIPFYGCHGPGYEYTEYVFASFDGEMVDIPALDATEPVIAIADEEDLGMAGTLRPGWVRRTGETRIPEAVAVPTAHVSSQITRIRQYFDLVKKVKETFKEDVEVTTA